MRSTVAPDVPTFTQLRIPMRGYERTPQALRYRHDLRYESPCGVMRALGKWRNCESSVLRIPMRGYEYTITHAVWAAAMVTNPHAGL